MGKYVAVGVLAVIVLAAATYDKPKVEKGKVVAEAGEPSAEEPVYAVDYGALDQSEAAEITTAALPVDALPSNGGQIAPPNTTEPAQPAPIVPAKKVKEYVVKANQTLSDVAEEVLGDRRAWRKIYEANKDRLSNPDMVRAGMKLVYDAVQTETTAPAPRRNQALTVPASAPRNTGKTYRVKKGDTLYRIASSQLGAGSRWKEIAQLNGITGARLRSGQVLKIPE